MGNQRTSQPATPDEVAASFAEGSATIYPPGAPLPFRVPAALLADPIEGPSRALQRVPAPVTPPSPTSITQTSKDYTISIAEIIATSEGLPVPTTFEQATKLIDRLAAERIGFALRSMALLTDKAVLRISEMLDDTSAEIRLKASIEILNRTIGKPSQSQAGRIGNPASKAEQGLREQHLQALQTLANIPPGTTITHSKTVISRDSDDEGEDWL